MGTIVTKTYLLILVSFFSTIIYSKPYCRSLLGTTKTQSYYQPTRIEKLFLSRMRPLTVEELLSEKILQLRKIDSDLAHKVVEARRKAERHESLEIDLSHLPLFMVNFLQGRYKKIVGKRGLSEPFVSIDLLDSKTLVIHHLEDKYPLMVQWVEGVKEVSSVNEVNRDNTRYRRLQIPAAIKSKEDLNLLGSSHIYKLISASRLHRNQDSRSSLIMSIASLLHEKKLLFERPSQQDFIEISKELNLEWELRKQIRSLLFIAPPAVGKTRIIGHSIVHKINKTIELLKTNSNYHKKLSIVMAKTPDLTTKLALDIGEQLFNDVGFGKYRIIQWGGSLSENIQFPELVQQIQTSNKPIVLVTSYQTLGSRVNQQQMKSLMTLVNQLSIDETHNATGEIFKRVFSAAVEEATLNRAIETNKNFDVLDILGTTATPITRTQRTIDIYDTSFSATIESPRSFSFKIKKNYELSQDSRHPEVLEHKRTIDQFASARERGEITAPDNNIHYQPQDFGHSFKSIFSRQASGTHSIVDSKKLEKIWHDIEKMIDGRHWGIINTAPRDADTVAETLAKLSGKNFVSLNVSQIKREAIYKAFKEGSLYQGKPVDAIVGKIREGLDFPRSEWFLSFLKYVHYPENIQAQGRVVRIALDKLPPVIIYFGEELPRDSFKTVSDLILKRIGRLPRNINNSRFYTAARKIDYQTSLGQVMVDINEAMESVVRMHQGQVNALNFIGQTRLPEEKKQQLVQAIKLTQDTLGKMRRTNLNQEIANSVRAFMNEVNSYSFFTGELKSTWSLCDKVIALHKKGEPYPNNLNNTISQLLHDSNLLQQVYEFRSMKSWLGKVPRALLETYDLRPNNLYEVVSATETFVQNRDMAPETLIEADKRSLAIQVSDFYHTSNSYFLKKLSFRTRLFIESAFDVQGTEASFESSLQYYVNQHGKFPEIDYSFISNLNSLAVDKIAHKLAQKLVLYLERGTLDLNLLSDSLKDKLDSSNVYRDLLEDLFNKFDVESLRKDVFSYGEMKITKQELSALFDLNDIQKLNNYALLRIVLPMAEMGFVHSAEFVTELKNKFKNEILD